MTNSVIISERGLSKFKFEIGDRAFILEHNKILPVEIIDRFNEEKIAGILIENYYVLPFGEAKVRSLKRSEIYSKDDIQFIIN